MLCWNQTLICDLPIGNVAVQRMGDRILTNGAGGVKLNRLGSANTVAVSITGMGVPVHPSWPETDPAV